MKNRQDAADRMRQLLEQLKSMDAGRKEDRDKMRMMIKEAEGFKRYVKTEPEAKETEDENKEKEHVEEEAIHSQEGGERRRRTRRRGGAGTEKSVTATKA